MNRAFDPGSVTVTETADLLVSTARESLRRLDAIIRAVVPGPVLATIVSVQSHQRADGSLVVPQDGSLCVFLPPQTEEHPGGQVVHAVMTGSDFTGALNRLRASVLEMQAIDSDGK